MTRTPLLVVLMLSLGCVATDRSRVPEVRALMDKSAAQLAAGDGSASAAALREAAVLVPTHEYGVRMEIVERLMLEHDEFELAYRLMQQVIVDTYDVKNKRVRRRLELMRLRLEPALEPRGMLEPCLSTDEPEDLEPRSLESAEPPNREESSPPPPRDARARVLDQLERDKRLPADVLARLRLRASS